MTIELIYEGAEKFINDLIITEFRAQGHTLTGAWEESLEAKRSINSKTATLTGYALSYGMLVNEGIQPDKITNKLFPGLVDYFTKRGLGIAQAKQAAGATIAKWKNEGMSTQASKRFSQTGGRQHFVEAAFIGNEPILDKFMENLFDFGVEEQFRKTKNETI